MQTQTIEKAPETIERGARVIQLLTDTSKKTISRTIGSTTGRVIPLQQKLLPGTILRMRKLVTRMYVRGVNVYETIKHFI